MFWLLDGFQSQGSTAALFSLPNSTDIIQYTSCKYIKVERKKSGFGNEQMKESTSVRASHAEKLQEICSSRENSHVA